MIDDKKIEKAAKDYIDKNNYFPKYDEDPCEDIEFAYKDGAKWAINEFLKDLWHPVSEDPKESIFMLSEYEKGKYYADYFDKNRGGWSNKRLIRWLNIDDLSPKKEEGNNHVLDI